MGNKKKVFFATVWDFYFFWRFDCNQKMMSGEFFVEIKKHLAFMLEEGETMPNLEDAIKELYATYSCCLDKYYQCEDKAAFVEKYG